MIEARYYKVYRSKGSCGVGSVALTLYSICNPAKNIQSEEKNEMVRYIVGSDDIKAIGKLI